MTSSPSGSPGPGPDGAAEPAAAPDPPKEPDLAGENLAHEASALRVTAKDLRTSLTAAGSEGIRQDAGSILQPLASVFTEISTITGTVSSRSGTQPQSMRNAYECLEHAHGALAGACRSLADSAAADTQEEPGPGQARGRIRTLMSLLSRAGRAGPPAGEAQRDSSSAPSAGTAVSHAEQLHACAEHLAQYSLPAYLEKRQDKHVPEAAALYRPLKTAVGDLKWGVFAVTSALRGQGLDNWLDPACIALANAESHLDQAWMQTGSTSLSVLAGKEFMPPAAAMPPGYAMTHAGRAVHSAFASGPAPGATARSQRPQGHQGPGKAQPRNPAASP